MENEFIEFLSVSESYSKHMQDYSVRSRKPKSNSIKIQDLNLSVRVKNACLSMGIITLNDLVQVGMNDLVKMRNFGVKSFKELKEYLDNSDSN